jgi:hypothetical protein
MSQQISLDPRFSIPSSIPPTPINSPALRIATIEDEQYLQNRSQLPSPIVKQEEDALKLVFNEVWNYEQLLLNYNAKLIPIEPLQPLPPLSISLPIAPKSTNETETSSESGDHYMNDVQPTLERHAPVDLPNEVHPRQNFQFAHHSLVPAKITRSSSPPALKPAFKPRPSRVPSAHYSSPYTPDSSPDRESSFFEPQRRKQNFTPNRNITRYAPFARPQQIHPRKHHSSPDSYGSSNRPNQQPLSYRAWPSYRQAIADRERNLNDKLDAMRAEYDRKRSEDAVQTTALAAQLNRAISNYRLESDFITKAAKVQIRQEDLDERATALDKRMKAIEAKELSLVHDQQTVSDWRDHNIQDTPGYYPSQSDRISRIYIQLTDVLKSERNITSPYAAFVLHRLIAPSLFRLTRDLTASYPAITASDNAISYYSLYVRELQHQLYTDEWDDFKHISSPYESPHATFSPRYRRSSSNASSTSSNSNPYESENGW